MKVITAVEKYERRDADICVFLAGGITKCPNWQKEVIAELQRYDLPNLVVFNPRRENFPIGNPNASQEQIEWEFFWLERIDIFSMYFSSGDSVQPICMYELGRNLFKMNFYGRANQCVVSVEKGYKREQDVIIQSKLATSMDLVNTDANPITHARKIAEVYNLFR